MSEKIRDTFIQFWDNLLAHLPNLLAALVVIAFFLLLGTFLQRILTRRWKARGRETIITTFAGNALRWVFYVIGFIMASAILGFTGLMGSILAGAGISAIIFGFAFKDIAENFLSGILLAINRPFRIGNIVEVAGFKGTVRGMDLRNTHIRNIDGRDIYIPNAMIVKSVLTNYTRDGLLRQEFVIGLDVPTDFPKVRKLVMEFLAGHKQVLAEPAPNLVVLDLGEFTVNVQVLFWVDILQNNSGSPAYLGLNIRSEVISEVKDLLLENGVNMPSQVLEHKMYREDQPLKVGSA